jgi:hypothetical protein
VFSEVANIFQQYHLIRTTTTQAQTPSNTQTSIKPPRPIPKYLDAKSTNQTIDRKHKNMSGKNSASILTKTEWYCSGCQFKNFKGRNECRECGKVRGNEDSNKKVGDWDCLQCQFVNFASRTECKNCGAAKGEKSAPKEHKPKKEHVKKESVKKEHTGSVEQDWKCVCGFLNYKSRTSCKNCNTSHEDAKKKEVDTVLLLQNALLEIEKLKKRVEL